MKKVFKEVAKKFNVSDEEVERDIRQVIEIGMANPDPAVQAKWKELFPDGKKPTPEELVSVLVKEVYKNNK